jgi:hypothetical protein
VLQLPGSDTWLSRPVLAFPANKSGSHDAWLKNNEKPIVKISQEVLIVKNLLFYQKYSCKNVKSLECNSEEGKKVLILFG